jgi:putative hydroxymethylpyrimidine transport system substrate-binding protein
VKISCAVAVAVLALLLAGCGGESSSEAKPKDAASHDHLLHLWLDANPGVETVALVMAKQMGYFKDAGLSVTLGRPVTLPNAFSYLAGGTVDLIVAPEPEAVLALEEELPVIAVRSVVRGSTEALIWLADSGIDGVADLKDKTIATPGLGFQEDFLEVVLAQAGLDRSDVKLESLPYDSAAALAGGRIDAIFGGSRNVDGVELEARGLKPVITPLQDLGIPPFEQAVLLADYERLPSEEDLTRFISAVRRGTAAAIEHPAAAARALAAESSEPEVNAAKWRAGLRATLPLLSESGRMSRRWANRLSDWMLGRGLVEFETPAAEVFTDRYLGQ